MCVCTQATNGDPEKALHLLELELQETVNHLMCFLGTRL